LPRQWAGSPSYAPTGWTPATASAELAQRDTRRWRRPDRDQGSKEGKAELIILRVARLQSAPYEISRHTDLARSAGLDERQINAITDGDLEDDRFSPTERAVLDAVTELCTARDLSDDSFGAVRAALGDAAMTELLMIVSCYYGLALVLNAADPEVDA
jgi:4-carboxymuconolactone decarboxylase